MFNTTNASRRQALKFLASVPMLPLGASAASSLLALGAARDAAAAPVGFASATFSSMAAPSLSDPAAMATTTVGSELTVKLADGSSQAFKLSYEPFFITGDMVPDGKGGQILAGGYYDIHNKPIIDTSVPGKERQFFSDCPDGTSLLAPIAGAKVDGVKGDAVFAVVQFEYMSRDQKGDDTYGRMPSPIAVLTLDQDPATGKLTLVKYHNVDTAQAHGLWITCGASLSPWNTHLSSEEYEPDAFAVSSNKQLLGFSKNLFGDEKAANPYHYGHLPEVKVNANGTGTLTKHYCIGRISHELVQVMPDQRTLLMGDDATNGGLFMFVADKEADLSAGTLYVAKFAGKLSTNTAASPDKISWVKLGHATSAEIEKLADTVKPQDIMEIAKEDPKDASFTKIAMSGGFHWVKLKPGMEKAAAFLETHRYAALMGGSLAFTKMEGTTVNAKDKVAYSAISYIKDSMVKGGKGWYETSGIGFEKPLEAGGILAHAMAGGQKDSGGAAIASDWVPFESHFVLTGEDIASDALGNTANPDKIGNPDNIKFSERLRTLFIGEDSGMHVNNFLWAYNVDTKELSRIMSVPAGAESTGLHAIDELNGWTYVMSNFQHPGDWEKIHSKVKDTLDPLVRANYKDRFGAAVGYLTADATSIKLEKA
ncbi:PhoX family protein [Rhizobium oryziradicis]|uniref:Alkaline phosphatase n=1 Tax=Rhizobium oryziradicis TaxID=1867956 RepID=A0A1Q8ZW87_9HYPH|nr:alkaline phosphatase PhoX [Rhizobium oryziradicis]OLP46344.1 alkaline phosphatase [Rhizobium oryziradicis]